MKTLLSLFRKNDGNVIIMVAVFILLIFAIGGAGVDFGRAQLVQMKEQQASDAAALAAATILDKNTNDPAEDAVRSAAAYRYYNLNFPATYLGVARNTPNYVFDKASGNITVGNSQNLTTNYITTMGRSNLDVAARTKVNIPNKNLPDFDVVMVIDVSGSTNEPMPVTGISRLDTEKAAVNDMIESLFPDNQPPNPRLRMGVVAHSGVINNAYGLTSDKNQAKSYIPPLDYYPFTFSHYGLEAGYNMISGNWSSFTPAQHCILHSPTNECAAERNVGVPPAVTLRDDGLKLSKVKYVVFITDGFIMRQAAPCDEDGVGDMRAQYPLIMADDVAAPGDTCRNYRKFYEQCDNIKNAGVTLFTINFAQEDASDIAPMKACASSPDKYFYAPDGDTLKGILSGIVKSANRVRITD